MSKNVFAVLLFALISCTTGFAQAPFQGLTAGISSRSDVERVLGGPVNTLDEAMFEYKPPGAKDFERVMGEPGLRLDEKTVEYKPPARIAKLVVGYRGESSLVEGIQVYFRKPVARSVLLRAFNLNGRADTRTVSEEGRLAEFFGGNVFLVLNYKSRHAGSGVSDITYCSRSLFENAVAWLRRESR